MKEFPTEQIAYMKVWGLKRAQSFEELERGSGEDCSYPAGAHRGVGYSNEDRGSQVRQI